MATVRQLEESLNLDEYAITKVTTMGHVVEVQTRQKSTAGSPCKKLDKDHYLDTRTGEVLEYQHIDNRSESTRSIRNTLSRIRALVNTNVTTPDNVRWCTFTYAENMTDTERLYQDFRKFWQKFKRWCNKYNHAIPEYITVQEPQGRGAWHIHAFFIWSSKAPYIDNNEVMAKLWGHGWTSTKALRDCDNIGAYFSAYLGDMPLEDVEKLSEAEKEKACSATSVLEKEFTDEQGRTKKKKFVKGGRLYLYPPGMNIVRTTKGIKQPEVEVMTLAEAREKVSSAKLTYSCAYEIIGDDGDVVNRIVKSYYNSKRH